MFLILPHTSSTCKVPILFFLPAPRYSLHIQFLSLSNGKMQPVTKALQSFPPVQVHGLNDINTMFRCGAKLSVLI